MNPEDLLPAVMTQVRWVGQQAVMPQFLKVRAERKQDGSALTAADLASQEALRLALPAIYPACFMGEEMTVAEQEQCWKEGLVQGLWVVDPIDGTTNFIHGLPYFAISVALLWQGRPVLGVVYNPARDEMFYAHAGGGAFLNGQALPLKTHQPRMQETLACVEMKWLTGRLPTRIATLAPYGSHRNLGASTLDWCYLAAGRFDLMLHGAQKLWDYAAGSLILQEAGGCMAGINLDDYWAEPLWSRSAVASINPALFPDWLHWVRSNR